MTYFEELLAKLTKPEAVAFIIGGTATAVVSQAWRRFQGRMFVLRYKVRHTSLAQSSGDVFGDKLQVLYRGQEVKGLYVTEAQFRNDSGSDLENLVITLEYRNGEQHYGGSGRLVGSTKNLPFSADFQKRVDRYLAFNDPSQVSPDLPFIASTREFLVPVLNRGCSVAFTILTHSDKFPYLHAVCHHKGLKIVEEKEVPMLLGVPTALAAIVGIIVGGIFLFVVYPFFSSFGWATLWSFLFGTAASIIGACVVLIWRLLLKVVGR